MTTDPIVIASIARTPIGSFQGVFAHTTAAELGGASISAAVQRATLESSQIDEVIMGCVLSAGQGQAPARQASFAAGLPNKTGCTTINKMCGSGMKSIMFAHDMLQAGTNNIMVAGGMESMSNAPYLLPKARSGYRMGHNTVFDHMFLDGLEDAYDKGKLMGVFAEDTAEQFSLSRKAKDDFALNSLAKAQHAINNDLFTDEIIPVPVQTKKITIEVIQDENPGHAKPKKIPELKPAFKKDGTITAANASSIADGAASVVLMRQSTAKKLNIKPMAKILAHSTHAHAANLFTTAPINAIQSVMAKAKLKFNDIDLFEINEAFAVVTMAATKELQLDPSIINIHGGACALGHPIGASGARIICTLVAALHQYNKKLGVAALCIGGGEATAMAIEAL